MPGFGALCSAADLVDVAHYIVDVLASDCCSGLARQAYGTSAWRELE
jgi:hypothetical protein